MGKTTLNYLEIPTLDGGVEILDMRDFASIEEIYKYKELFDSQQSKTNEMITAIENKYYEQKKWIDELKNAFRIVSCEDDNIISFGSETRVGKSSNYEFSKDGLRYYDIHVDDSFVLRKGEALYLRIKDGYYSCCFEVPLLQSTKEFDAEGRVVEISDRQNKSRFVESFAYLFAGSKIRNAKDIIMPSKEEADYNRICIYMFKDCKSLISSPKLIDSISYMSYSHMFEGCTSLITAPELHAMELASNCYEFMFSGCTSLSTAPELPAMKLADDCYWAMFLDCTSLATAPELPAMKLAYGCYRGMFSGCTSLSTAPELPAMDLAAYCYGGMFTNCHSLEEAPRLPALRLVDYCYFDMFQNCRFNSAPDLPATELAIGCYMQMFNGCNSIKVSPNLHAKVLKDWSYCGMFQNCYNLEQITCLAEDISAQSCLNYWVNGVKSNGTFYKSPNMTSLPIGTNGIPEGWTIQDYAE